MFKKKKSLSILYFLSAIKFNKTLKYSLIMVKPFL